MDGAAKPRTVDDIEAELTELAAHVNAATYRMLELVLELEQTYPWDGSGWRSTAHYLSWRMGLDPGAALEKVRVARALPALPRVSDALRRGVISYSKVRALTRVATPETEEDLLDLALAGTAAHVERIVRAYRTVQRNAELEHTEAMQESRSLETHWDDNGMLVVRGRLTPEEGARFLKTLEAFESLLRKEERSTENAGDVSAETSRPPVGAWEVAGSTEIPVQPGDMPAGRAFGQRSADALVRMADAAVAGADVISDAARCQVVVHVDAAALANPEEPGRSELDCGSGVCAETSRRLACDCDVVAIVDGPDGEPLDIGRKKRVIPTAMRRALTSRDACCRFPGCTATRFLQGHHIEHWAGGGATKLTNLVQLCTFHHRCVHEGGVRVRTRENGEVGFFWREQGWIHEAPALPDVGGDDDALVLRDTAAGIFMTPDTGIPEWEGEALDLPGVIAWLFQDRDPLDAPTAVEDRHASRLVASPWAG